MPAGEILGITQEDGEGAGKLREAYRDEKATEEHQRKEVPAARGTGEPSKGASYKGASYQGAL